MAQAFKIPYLSDAQWELLYRPGYHTKALIQLGLASTRRG